MGNKANVPGEDHVSGQSNKPLTRPVHALTYQQVEQELGTNALDGLSVDEAKSRLEQFGRNELGDSEGVQPIKIIIAQFANAMTMVNGPAYVARLFASCRLMPIDAN
jgi:magnesium-transporting ATPase (P-type)